MITKLKFTLLAMMLALFAVQPALASPLNNDDMAFAFSDTSVTSSELGEVSLLSEAEMNNTEGDFWPIAIRFAYHGAHHTFRWVGRSRHFQMNWWRPGVKGSGGAVRIPWQWWKR